MISIWKKAKHLTGNLSSSMYLHLAQEATLLTPNEKKVVCMCVFVCACVSINLFAPYRNFYKIYGSCIDFVLRPYFRNGVPYDVLVENVRKCCQHYNMNIILSLLDCFETQNINKMDNAVLTWGNKHLTPVWTYIFDFIYIHMHCLPVNKSQENTKHCSWQSIELSGARKCKYSKHI